MLYIRVNMNRVIATGHVMRCLSIADAAREKNEEVTFILSDNQAEAYIGSRGYQTLVLNTRWDDLDGELSVITEVIQQKKITSLLVDSYQVTEFYLKKLSEITKVIYLDDLNRFIYPVDAIICYANYWKKFQYEKNYLGVKLFLGTEYVPIRKVFSNVEKEIRDKVESLLLLSGGNDEYHILAGILQVIKTEDFEKITVICGKYDKNYEQLAVIYKNQVNISIYQGVTDIEKYMKEADLAVSAGGTTLYELCACGTPAISYALADNQLDNVKQFAEDSIIDYAGDVRVDPVVENINALMNKYIYDKELRRKRSKKMQQLIDGRGAERIAEQLIQMK